MVVIVQKMLDYLKESKEEYAIITLAGKIAELAEKYPFIFQKPFGTFQSIFHDLLRYKVLQLCFSLFKMQTNKCMYSFFSTVESFHSVKCILIYLRKGRNEYFLISTASKGCSNFKYKKAMLYSRESLTILVILQ